MKKLQSYLRTHRRRWGLTQQELSYLVGAKSGTIISRLEWQKRLPSVRILFALQVIFGVPPGELFPGPFAQIEEEVIRRGHDLHERLQGNSSKTTSVKLELLESALNRAMKRSANDGV